MIILGPYLSCSSRTTAEMSSDENFCFILVCLVLLWRGRTRRILLLAAFSRRLAVCDSWAWFWLRKLVRLHRNRLLLLLLMMKMGHHLLLLLLLHQLLRIERRRVRLLHLLLLRHAAAAGTTRPPVGRIVRGVR